MAKDGEEGNDPDDQKAMLRNYDPHSRGRPARKSATDNLPKAYAAFREAVMEKTGAGGMPSFQAACDTLGTRDRLLADTIKESLVLVVNAQTGPDNYRKIWQLPELIERASRVSQGSHVTRSQYMREFNRLRTAYKDTGFDAFLAAEQERQKEAGSNEKKSPTHWSGKSRYKDPGRKR